MAGVTRPSATAPIGRQKCVTEREKLIACHLREPAAGLWIPMIAGDVEPGETHPLAFEAWLA